MGKAIKNNIIQGLVKDNVATKSPEPVTTPVVIQPQPELAVSPLQQVKSCTQISATERDEMFRTRERRSYKMQALIPPSLHEALVAKAKERKFSVAETLIRALRVGLPQI